MTIEIEDLEIDIHFKKRRDCHLSIQDLVCTEQAIILNRKQAIALLPVLTRFSETGSIEEPKGQSTAVSHRHARSHHRAECQCDDCRFGGSDSLNREMGQKGGGDGN